MSPYIILENSEFNAPKELYNHTFHKQFTSCGGSIITCM